MRIHYLLAGSIRHADTTATIDCGWRRDRVSNRKGFRDADGDFVLPVSIVEHLRGMRPPSKLYLGHDWWRVRGADQAVEIHRMLGGTAEEATALSKRVSRREPTHPTVPSAGSASGVGMVAPNIENINTAEEKS